MRRGHDVALGALAGMIYLLSRPSPSDLAPRTRAKDTEGCPCGCDRSAKMAADLRKAHEDVAPKAIEKSRMTIGERENVGYITERIVQHRLRLLELVEELQGGDRRGRDTTRVPEYLTGEARTLSPASIDGGAVHLPVSRWYREGGRGEAWNGVLGAREGACERDRIPPRARRAGDGGQDGDRGRRAPARREHRGARGDSPAGDGTGWSASAGHAVDPGVDDPPAAEAALAAIGSRRRAGGRQRSSSWLIKYDE